LWNAHVLPRRRPLLTWDEIRQLAQSGFTIGAHSRTHRQLPTLTDSELESEIAGSRDDLMNRAALQVTHFAYPQGLFDSRVVRQVQEAGFESASATRQGSPTGLWTLQRIPVSTRDGILRFTTKLLKAWSGWYTNRFRNRLA
jgi:peptidoglycan/xylan/chitin deacetylase (PgdA/CDA1 family)